MKEYHSPLIDSMTEILLNGNIVPLSSFLSKMDSLVKEFGTGPVQEVVDTLVVIPQDRLRFILRHLIKVGIFFDLSKLEEELSEEEIREFNKEMDEAEEEVAREKESEEKSVSERVLDELLSSMNLRSEDDKKNRTS